MPSKEDDIIFNIAHETFKGLNKKGGIPDKDTLKKFAHHLRIVKHIRVKKDDYSFKKQGIKNKYFRKTRMDLHDCKCLTEDCSCIEKIDHPLHTYAVANYNKELNFTKKLYKEETLGKYKIQHKDLDISDEETVDDADLIQPAGYYDSFKLVPRDAYGSYSPTSPHYGPYSPTSP